MWFIFILKYNLNFSILLQKTLNSFLLKITRSEFKISMKIRPLFLSFIIAFFTIVIVQQMHGQSNLFVGSQNRIVVFARFNGDPDIDTPRTNYESMFNGETNSLKSYFKAISNDKLTINSLLYPQNTATGNSYELKFCYFCYDTSWKGSYPNCKGSEITSLYDINIGFIIKDLAAKLNASGELPDASVLDSDNDGIIDNFVIVFRGAARGIGKGIYTPQIGEVSSIFTNTNGIIQVAGKTIKKYTITYERNSLETHCRFLLSSLGFPVQYRNTNTQPRSVGAWDPMDGPQLSYPLVYNRMKYTKSNWISAIPQISAPGTYSLSSANNGTNNAYKILSSNPKQYWVLEYRNKSVTWDTNLPESGLIIYRVNENYTGSVNSNSEVYLYRKDGSSTVFGDILNAPFSDLNGRTAFNSTTNPISFFTDGTVSNDIDVSDIKFDNGLVSFKVNTVIMDVKTANYNEWSLFVEPSSRTMLLRGEGIKDLTVYSVSGSLVVKSTVQGVSSVQLPNLKPGIYLATLKGELGEKVIKFILN
jgi:M6 family metalloprotease-like protein